MRVFLSRIGLRINAAWVVPLALAALPNCSFEHGVSGSGPHAVPPGTTLVPCDLHLNLQERRCATAEDLVNGVRLAEAAIALAQGNTGKILGIDDSPAALARCSGQPEAMVFQGEYPAGLFVCVDPAQVATPSGKFATSTDVCVEKCLDIVNAADPPDPLVLDFCRQRSQASTNVSDDPNSAFGDSCSAGGQPVDFFVDPRLVGEPTLWTNAVGVDTTGGNLTRTAPCTATPCSGFDAGAAGVKPITHGDGYLEFSVSEVNTNRIGGLTTGSGADDHDVNFTDIGFGIDFFRDGCFYVFEGGVRRPAGNQVMGCAVPPDAFGHYAPGDRFRISFKDNFNGTATISYAKLPGPCTPGADCPAPSFFIGAVAAAYPLHVDAAFEDLGALLDVRVVYIH